MTHSPLPWQTHTQQPTALFDANGKRIFNPYPNVDLGTAADNVALILGYEKEIERLRAQVERLAAASRVLLDEAENFSVSGVYFNEDCMGHKGPDMVRDALNSLSLPSTEENRG